MATSARTAEPLSPCWTTGAEPNAVAALPRGWRGRIGGLFLRHGGAVEQREVAGLLRDPVVDGADVVEVGCGPGVLLAELARGPARLCALLGVGRDHNGADVLDPSSPVRLQAGPPVGEAEVRTGPRVGVAAGQGRPWRLWVAGSRAVTPYKAGRTRPDGIDW